MQLSREQGRRAFPGKREESVLCGAADLDEEDAEGDRRKNVEARNGMGSDVVDSVRQGKGDREGRV